MARSSRSKKASSRGKKRGRKKSNVVEVDFEGVEVGGGRIPVPDGPHPMHIHKATLSESDSSGEPMIAFQHRVDEKSVKKGKGATIFDNRSLQPQALFALRGLLEAIGEEVPDGVMDVDIDELVGREFIGIVENEDYEGSDRPRIVGYLPIDGEEEEEDDGEEEEEDDGEEEEEDEDGEEEEEDDGEEEEEEEPPKKRRGKGKKATKLRAGSKVKFKDEDGNWVKGVINALNEDSAEIEDSYGEEWEVELDELQAV